MQDSYKDRRILVVDDEERMVRDAVRDWVSDRFMPLIEDAYVKGYFPKDLVPELAELGVVRHAVALVAHARWQGIAGLQQFHADDLGREKGEGARQDLFSLRAIEGQAGINPGMLQFFQPVTNRQSSRSRCT